LPPPEGVSWPNSHSLTFRIERIVGHEQMLNQDPVERRKQESRSGLRRKPEGTEPLLLRPGDELDQHASVARIDFQHLLVKPLREALVVKHLCEEEPDRVGVVAHEVQVEFDQFPDLRTLVEYPGLFGKIDEVRFEQAVQHRNEQLFLGLEVPKDQRLADVRLACDLRHRSLVEPTVGEQMHRRLQDFIPRILGTT
jgi:hypothetical protein